MFTMSDALDHVFEQLPERLDVDQLTEVLGLSNRAITYRWLRDGRIPAIKLGTTWVILRDDVKEHMRAHYNRPAASDTEPGAPDTQIGETDHDGSTN